VSEFALWALAADAEGEAADAETAARHALSNIKSLGRRLARDGKIIDDDAEAVSFIANNVAPVIDGFIPIWRQLGAWLSAARPARTVSRPRGSAFRRTNPSTAA
jgi:hypothetical protein